MVHPGCTHQIGATILALASSFRHLYSTATFISLRTIRNRMSIEVSGIAIHGEFDPRFEATVAQFASNFVSGNDVGASFAMSKDGEMVIDIWAGHQDEEKQVPWERDTIINVYSSTKTVSFLCALLLADRGELDFEAPVANYWPEFAAAGKENVLVWHFMNHAAGLSGVDQDVSLEDMCNWETMTGLLAAQAPWWEPGTVSGYHALTQGYLIGELVRRVSRKSIGQFTRDELSEPLGADFYIGVPDSEFPRICNLIPTPEATPEADPDTIAGRTFARPAHRAEDSWTDIWRRAEIPAVNGHGNARALCRLQTPLACGGRAFGVDLMSEKTARSVMQERISGEDLVLGAPLTFGLGFGLNRAPVLLSPNTNACYWGGWGGSSVLVDQDARTSMSYVMNKMAPGTLGDPRAFGICQQAYQDLG